MKENWLLRMAPATFVLLWSTGFVGTKYSMVDTEPFTFLALRFVLATAVIALLVVFFKSKVPARASQCFHLAVAGCLIHGVYLGGVFYAVHIGMPAGVSAIIVGLHPLLTTFVAARLLGESISRINQLGLLLGFSGIVFVIGGDQLLNTEFGVLGVTVCMISLLGMSLGTIYQKKFCSDADLLTGTCVQYIAAALFLSVPMLLMETRQINWTNEVIGAMLWLIFVLSVAAVLLLMLMIKHGEANRVASLFFLAPALTNIETWVLFDEVLSSSALVGIVLCMGGVYLARLPARQL